MKDWNTPYPEIIDRWYKDVHKWKRVKNYEQSILESGPLYDFITEKFNEKLNFMKITEIHIVRNHAIQSDFIQQMEHFEYNRTELNLFNTYVSPDPQKQYLINTLKKLFIRQDVFKRTNVLLTFHGTSSALCDSIFQGGLQNLRNLDGGWFGAGIYVTPDIDYAIKSYSLKTAPNDHGEYCVLVCLCVVGITYPLTLCSDDFPEYPKEKISKYHCDWPKEKGIRNDKALNRGFDSHFIGVSYEMNYNASEFADDSTFYELVFSSNKQVLPLAVVYLSK